MINHMQERCVYCKEPKKEHQFFPLYGLSGEKDDKGRHIFGRACRVCYRNKKLEFEQVKNVSITT